MKRWMALALLVFVGAAGWRIGSTLSSDALSMATGILFGVMAGVPTALLVIASNRHRSTQVRTAEINPRELPNHTTRLPAQYSGQAYPQLNHWGMPHAPQPPIIIVAGPQGFTPLHPTPSNNMAANHMAWLPPEPPARHFNVVGENEAFIDEW
jgi:hypothetical protein